MIKKIGFWINFLAGLAALSFLIITGAYALAFWDRIVPGVSVYGLNIGNRTATEARVEVEQLRPSEIKIKYQDYVWLVKPEEIGLVIDYEETIYKAYGIARSGNLWNRWGEAQEAFSKGKKIAIVYRLDEQSLDEQIAQIAGMVEIEAIEPSVRQEGKELVAVQGRNGLLIDRERLDALVRQAIEYQESLEFELPTVAIEKEFAEEALARAEERAVAMLDRALVLRAEEIEYQLDSEELLDLVGFGEEEIDSARVKELVVKVATGVDREPVDAVFKFEGGKVKEFKAEKKGIQVEVEASAEMIVKALQEGQSEVELVATTTDPKVTTAEVNNLGIEELIGVGESYFSHSIADRIHNLTLASERLNGVIVKPGETFSYNKAVGEISGATGYRAAYVISGGRTVLGDGGGVCQTSTTLFRAALDSGLPIVERKAHAYRVSYYEEKSEVGVDATVYAPTVDFKFTNNTPAHILIQTYVDPGRHYMRYEFYGKSDGRVSEISKSRVSGVVGAPPALYQDDPTLPAGTIKQIDWAASGARVSFDYKVTRDGEVLENETFYSNYRPWRAVYLRGTKAN